VQALWGLRNGLERWYDVLAVWREWADHVEGHGIECGHYLAEEAPNETFSALQAFLEKSFRTDASNVSRTLKSTPTLRLVPKG
jgi:haloacetate dehalogenase